MHKSISLLIIALALIAAWPLAGCQTAFAADINYYATPPSPDEKPYSIEPSIEPQLDAQQAWQDLRAHVKYVFVIYQENRSFDSYFGTFPGADGLFSRPAAQTPGFNQELFDIEGKLVTVHPFRLGPANFAADTDDVDHSHDRIIEKMHVVSGQPQMDRFALVEEAKYFVQPAYNRLQAKQFGELTMAYEDGDTVPFLWRYADRFVLFDHIFQLMAGPSTPGNLSIIAAQGGQTQWALHPDQAPKPKHTKGVPVDNDDDPLWGSTLDKTQSPMPSNPQDPVALDKIQKNMKFASLPLSMQGGALADTAKHDADPDDDLEDLQHDIPAITQTGKAAVSFGWYQEGYDQPIDPDWGPLDAEGHRASYITHHDGPQYFGYIANNPELRKDLHGLDNFYADIKNGTLPEAGGLFYVKGGYVNSMNLKSANPLPAVQKNFRGNDDHPGYSDAQISEAMVAQTINSIAQSKYWNQCAIIITWDDSEGDYDHVPPPIRENGPDGLPMGDGPRVPLLMISPYSRVHYVAHQTGDHASVVKFVDHLFNLIPLADLPDEKRAKELGKKEFGIDQLAPADSGTPDVTDLLDAFDPARLSGKEKPLPPDYATIPDALLHVLPQTSGFGLKDLGITPVDQLLGIKNDIPDDFNPRPKTDPSPAPAPPDQP